MTARKTAMDARSARALELLRDARRHPEKYPHDLIILPMDPEILRKVFSDERVRMLLELRGQSCESIDRLARRLRRDRTRVGRDVAALETYGLLRTTRKGKMKRVEAKPLPIYLV